MHFQLDLLLMLLLLYGLVIYLLYLMDRRELFSLLVDDAKVVSR